MAKRILFLAPQPFFTQRGTPIAVLATLQALSARGDTVDVLTYGEGEDVRIPGCTIHRIPRIPLAGPVRPGFSIAKLLADVLMLAGCLRMLRTRRYDLVHAVEEGVFMALLGQLRRGVPYVYDMDSSLAEQLSEQLPPARLLKPLLTRAEAVAVRRSVGVLAVCRSVEEAARGHDPGALVHRVEDAAWRSTAASGERLRDAAGPGPIVLYVGNLVAYQGIDLLLDAFRMALGTVPEARLVIIGGSDANRERYASVARQHGTSERVHLLGPRPLELLPWFLGQADVLVSPRVKGTNTPMKIYSYMDSGVPILATRLPTHTQVLDDDSAVLRDPRPETMAKGLELLLRNPDTGRTLAANARARVEREFTPEAHRRKLLDFFDAVEGKLEGRVGVAAPASGGGAA